uniref:Secreted protein n=1 Tax=Oryza barthii TaxID=65489 RepID=A0A0D3FS57_9ORYZ
MMMAPPLLPLLLSYPLLRFSSSFFLSLCKPVHYGDNDGGPAAREERIQYWQTQEARSTATGLPCRSSDNNDGGKLPSSGSSGPGLGRSGSATASLVCGGVLTTMMVAANCDNGGVGLRR